jgi:hypothetical protein
VNSHRSPFQIGGFELIENRVIAKQVSDLMSDVCGRLDESVAWVKDGCSHQEFLAYRKIMGTVIGEITLELLRPLYLRHPEIKPPGFD